MRTAYSLFVTHGVRRTRCDARFGVLVRLDRAFTSREARMPLTIDFTHMMSPAIRGGLTEQEWRGAADAFAAAHQAVVDKHTAGTLGFLDLPDDEALVRQTLDFAARAKGTVDDVVVLGIGGSALGPIALRTALVAPHWNLLPAGERGGFPRLHVLDNVDPATMHALPAPVGLG